MNKIWIYGISMAVLMAVLKVLEYRYHITNLSIEVYISSIAILFTAIGIWAGIKLNQPKRNNHIITQINTTKASDFGISPRELEVLHLMAEGYSNQEIAEKLFVSVHTIKTHSSSLFSKLQAKRRTQAVQKAKALNIL